MLSASPFRISSESISPQNFMIFHPVQETQTRDLTNILVCSVLSGYLWWSRFAFVYLPTLDHTMATFTRVNGWVNIPIPWSTWVMTSHDAGLYESTLWLQQNQFFSLDLYLKKQTMGKKTRYTVWSWSTLSKHLLNFITFHFHYIQLLPLIFHGWFFNKSSPIPESHPKGDHFPAPQTWKNDQQIVGIGCGLQSSSGIAGFESSRQGDFVFFAGPRRLWIGWKIEWWSRAGWSSRWWVKFMGVFWGYPNTPPPLEN